MQEKRMELIYKASVLQTLGNGLRRHYLEHLGVDIVHDKAFAYSTKVFTASVTDLRRKSLGTINHHTPITKDDTWQNCTVAKQLFLMIKPQMVCLTKSGLRLCIICAEEGKKT